MGGNMSITNEKKMELAGQARINEVTVRWSMNQLFFLIHSGALSFLVLQFKPDVSRLIYALVSFVGLWFSILWFLATHRAQKLVDYWHRKMAELEESERDPLEKRIDVFFSEEEPSRVPSPPGVPLYLSLRGLVWTFILIWSAAFVVFLTQWIKTF